MRNGTDALAIACIVGGGLIAGGVTLALASGTDVPSLECATRVGPDADVVLNLGGEGLVVVTPGTRVRELGECMDAERVRFEADRVRREADRVRVRVRRGVDVPEAEERAIAELRQRLEAVAADAERVELQRKQEVLERLSGGRADRQREQMDRQGEQMGRQGEQMGRQQEQMERQREQMDRQRERMDRQRERVERARERMARVERERLVERVRAVAERQAAAAERAARAPSEEIEVADVGVTGTLADGFRIRLPDRTFDVRFEGLEDFDVDVDWDDFDAAELDEQQQEQIERALRTQLQVLESLDLDFDEIDEGLAREIEQALDREMEVVEQHLAELLEEIRGR